MSSIRADHPDAPPPTSGPGSPVLELRDGGRRVPGSGSRREWLWRHLQLALRPGELLVVAGPTGSGKSLLLRALATLDELDAGQVCVGGRTADEWPVTTLRRSAAYLHQSPALFPGTVEDNLREPFTWEENASGSYRRERALALLAPLGRGKSFLERSASELSGGERQILAIVRAMLLRPEVLLLDEPTAALDPDATDAVERLVRSWIDEGGSALWVTHDRGQARRIGDRRLLLADGDLRPLDGEG